MWDRTAALCLVALLPACASAPFRRAPMGIGPEDLLAARPLGLTVPAAGLDDEEALLAPSPAIRAFVEQQVSRRADRTRRLWQLTTALIQGLGSRLKYDETTRTAAATFEARRGNCLSFANMFVALARQAGLPASFQEVDGPPDWSLRGESFVLNRHVNVLVDLGRAGEQVVDFNVDDFRTTYERRLIGDARARAHYYNNVAVERLQAGDAASALGNLRKALANDSGFSPAWTTLGMLYRRGGHPGHAEAAYHQALKADGADAVAMSNLSWLYEQQGDRERAAWYRARVAAHRDKNPYYHYQLARRAFHAADYDTAIGHLKRAIRAKRNDDEFYSLLSQSYMKKGDARAARRYLAFAEEVATTDALRRRYASKMEALGQRPRDAAQPQ